MKLLTILVTVFGGGTVWVGADYFIELRALTTTAPSSSRTPAVRATFLYKCVGVRAPAFIADVSQCTPVPPEQKANVYFSYNFYQVHKPNLMNHVIQFSDRRFAPKAEWNLGYYRHVIDHPNFEDPSEAEIKHFGDNLALLGVDEVVPQYLLPVLANYFAQTNLIAIHEKPTVGNSFFSGFTTFLRRIMDEYDDLSKEPVARKRRVMMNKLARAMLLSLQKMIDPCNILHGDFKAFAFPYCDTYCTFLGFASRHFETANNWCSLEGGRCVGLICTCNRVMNTPFTGCLSVTSPMHLCHNYLREGLYY